MTHTFTLSGLGEAPFKMVAPTKDCPTFFCEHCGRMLKNQYFVKSSDNKVSVVGVDCVKRTGDTGLMTGVLRQQRERRAAIRLEKKRIEALGSADKERSLLGGMTRQEVMEQFDTRILALKDEITDKVRGLPVYEVFTFSNFGIAMIDNAIRPSPFNDGATRTMVSIIAKHLSKSRVNSIAYKEAVPLAEKQVADLVAVGAECDKELSQIIAQRNALLDKLKQ